MKPSSILKLFIVAVLVQYNLFSQNYSEQYYYTTNGENADIQVRVGDVDNLGFGWDDDFDPFCGENTSRHPYPWDVDEKDHQGTDRIMVVSSYKSGRKDGYVSNTSRPQNKPVGIPMKFDKPNIEINQIVLQMMLDDFQAPVWGTAFQFHINGKRLTYVEDIINSLNQTGPTGKLVQVGILPEDFHLFETGNIEIKIDDPVTGAGGGFAIDFIQLLINPREKYKCIGTIKGIVKDEQNNPLKDVLVSANGLKESLTDQDGTFNLNTVPVGMLSVIASKHSYRTESVDFELKREDTKDLTLILKKQKLESEDYVSNQLNEKGFVNLYGILFDTGKDIPKKESEPTLRELANFVKNNTNLKIEIVGHTDSDGDESSNKDLSLRRAQEVMNWLKGKNIDVSEIKVDGKGESSPVASNKTASGKAMNRRVEVKTYK